MIVTINPSVKQPSECEHVSLMNVLKRFKTHDKNNIELLRAEEDPDKQQKMKIDLPVAVFGGKFSDRKNSGLIEASGLMILDFDCYSQAESNKIKTQLSDDEYVLSYFKSTRGFGYKALIRIPIVKDDKEYKQYWNAVEKRFPNVDPACKDIARACFYTYDPELVINKDAKVWDVKESDNIQRASVKISKGTNYALVNRALNLIRMADVGERHNKILSASRLCGGWVASGKVDYQEAQRLLEQEALYIDPQDFKTNQLAITDGLDHGMRDPLDDEKYFQEQDIEQKFDKIYWTLKDVEDELDAKYEEGLKVGYKTGYKDVDELYSLHLGYTTYIYGAAFSGKSLVWFDFLKNFSYRYGMKHVIFSPETGSATDVHIKLIEMVAGSDFYDKGYGRMSYDQRNEAKKFVDEHFIVIDPEMKQMSLAELIASCEMIERVFNTKIHTLTIDPWNDLFHNMKEFNYRQDMYLEKLLRDLRVTAQFNQWHICVITHTSDQAFEGSGAQRFQPPATFREIAGGQAWSRRGFMMASVWRPPVWMDEFNGDALEGNETFWFQQKYKPEWAGARGTACLKYDIKKKRYYGKGLHDTAVLNKQDEAKQFYSMDAPF